MGDEKIPPSPPFQRGVSVRPSPLELGRGYAALTDTVKTDEKIFKFIRQYFNRLRGLTDRFQFLHVLVK